MNNKRKLLIYVGLMILIAIAGFKTGDRTKYCVLLENCGSELIELTKDTEAYSDFTKLESLVGMKMILPTEVYNKEKVDSTIVKLITEADKYDEKTVNELIGLAKEAKTPEERQILGAAISKKGFEITNAKAHVKIAKNNLAVTLLLTAIEVMLINSILHIIASSKKEGDSAEVLLKTKE